MTGNAASYRVRTMSKPSEPSARGSSRSGPRAWLLAAAALLVFAPRVWNRGGQPHWFTLAQTPLDRPSPAAAAQWKFLTESLAVLPPGATYTIFAPTLDEEMNLFAMSIGLHVARGHLPVPSSYLGVPYPGGGAGADYALDYGCGRAASPAYENVVRVWGGCVAHMTRSARSGPPPAALPKAAKP